MTGLDGGVLRPAHKAAAGQCHVRRLPCNRCDPLRVSYTPDQQFKTLHMHILRHAQNNRLDTGPCREGKLVLPSQNPSAGYQMPGSHTFTAANGVASFGVP